MTLIELYVAEVGRRLPLQGRGDIEAELRSTLEDMLDDRSRKEGRPADEAMVVDLLRDYGPPDKVAATYNPHQYLIGPRLYPFFIRVLKIVLTVLTIVLLVTLGIQLGSQPLTGPGLAQAIAKGLAGILGAALQAFGNIALVFAILERVLPATEFKMDEETKAWDPASLKKEAEPETIKPWEPIIGILFTAAAMIVFNDYSELIGIHFLKDGVWTSIPALSEAFFRWLPYINVLWALQLALNVVLLRQGRQQPFTKWSALALDAAGVVMGYFLISGPPIVRFSTQALISSGLFDASTAAAFNLAAQQGTRVIIIIVIIVQGVDIVKDIIRQILKRR